MNTGIDKITDRIEADARAAAASIQAEADAKCAALRAENEKKAQDAYWTSVRSGVKECEDRVDRMGRMAEMEARKSTLQLKQTMVSEAFDRAVEKICTLPQDEYVSVMAGLAARASVSGTEEILFSADDRGRCGSAVAEAANKILAGSGRPAKLTLGQETRDIRAGFVLKEGDVEINCAVEILAQLCRNELAAQVAEVLFS